jgi:hypothetical protein
MEFSGTSSDGSGDLGIAGRLVKQQLRIPAAFEFLAKRNVFGERG